jgi:GT2 family glycosyltransferase
MNNIHQTGRNEQTSPGNRIPIAAAPAPKVSRDATTQAVPTLAILLTCFNRRDKTVETLRSLASQSCRFKRRAHVILVDDGSRDGTGEAVLASFPDTEVIRGTGSLFWNGGMRVAFARAQEIGFDYYLLLNDDTVLVPHCLDTLFETAEMLAREGVSSIVAASTCDPVTGQRTYGGIRRVRRWNGIRDIKLEPLPDAALRCDTMNGNCVLIPAVVARRIGNLEKGYTQQFGDYDYGFRATRAGLAVHIAPGYLGSCPNNPPAGTWRDEDAPFRTRWKQLMSPKGIPLAEWFLFARRHFGYLWPLYFVSPYMKVLVSRFGMRLRSVRHDHQRRAMPEGKTRVLHVLGQLERSGAEMMLLQSAAEWQRHGYALDLLATGPPNGPKNGSQISPMAAALAQAGYGIHPIPFRSRLRYLPSLLFVRQFLALCRSRRFDVLHLHTEAAMPLFVALGRWAGIPTIVRTVHNTFTFTGPLGLRKRVERRLARAAGVRFAFVSESVEQVEGEYFGNPGTYTPNWFDTAHFRPPSDQEREEARRALACPDDATVIVTIGNCNAAKNHEALLRALAPLAGQRKLLYLHVGREPEDRAERALARALGLGESIRFAGSHPDPRAFLWAADLFVMPSLREGLSIAALEGVGAGTPALFTNVRGLRDIANRALWITQVEPDGLAAGIESCCGTPPRLARERALADSAMVHREYSIEGGVAYLVKELYRDPHASATAPVTHPELRPS